MIAKEPTGFLHYYAVVVDIIGSEPSTNCYGDETKWIQPGYFGVC